MSYVNNGDTFAPNKNNEKVVKQAVWRGHNLF